MNALMPIIEELEDAADDAARARWLLSCPLLYLLKYQDTIRNRLRIRGFLAGVDYLDAEIVRMRAVRRMGELTERNPLRLKMMDIAGFEAFRG